MKNAVLITGASSGIGEAMAIRFASEGFNLILVARRRERLRTLGERIERDFGVRVLIRTVDLSDSAMARELYDSVRAHDIAVWINNAGFGDYNKGWAANVEKISAMIDLNVGALTALSMLYARDNRERDVQLINVSSRMGYFIHGDAVAYSATKFFVTSFTEGLARNLQEAGCRLRVKLLAPGPVDTEFEAVATTHSDHEPHQWENAHTPEEVADFAFRLYEGDKVLGIVDSEKRFTLEDPLYPYAG